MLFLLYKHQWNTKPFHFNSFLVWKAWCNVAIAKVIFSHVKIWSFRVKAHLVFHWCLYNNRAVRYFSITFLTTTKMTTCYMNYLCDTVMGICDSDNSGFGYKSVHTEGNYHHSTGSKYIKFNIYHEHHQKAEEKHAHRKNSSPLPTSNLICIMGRRTVNPLNPKIKIWILICCPCSFPTEVVGRSW